MNLIPAVQKNAGARPIRFGALLATALVALFVVGDGSARLVVTPSWRYTPTSKNDWDQTIKLIQTKKFSDALDSIGDQKERRLLTGKILAAAGYPAGAAVVLVDVFVTLPGSPQGQEALLELAKLWTDHTLDPWIFLEAFRKSNPKEVPAEAATFAKYFLWRSHSDVGFSEWAKEFYEPSPQMVFDEAVSAVATGKDDEAIASFESLLNGESTPSRIKERAGLQLARLYFGKAEYEKADTLYKGIPLVGRTGGRILFERAWARYWQKDYSLSLGLLKASQAPFFDRGLDPEQFILQSLILRDLCQYKHVAGVYEKFLQVYGDTLKAVKEAKDLAQNPILLTMALQRRSLQMVADTVDQFRKELVRFKKEFGDDDQATEIVKLYQLSEQSFRNRIALNVARETRREAERLLEVADQIRLLEYLSGLDENRIATSGEARNYEAESADKFRFDTLFWPVSKVAAGQRVENTEYWLEEVENYRVLISDRCKGGP
jgi:hypothetical protein